MAINDPLNKYPELFKEEYAIYRNRYILSW